MDHPAVAAGVTFAMPHDKLGEEVAAAVVLREGATATERELRDFAPSRLADFKVPRKIVFLAEIPKGATGKLQRIGLAQKLGLGSCMRICVFGAGAIGGLLGAKLAAGRRGGQPHRARPASRGDPREGPDASRGRTSASPSSPRAPTSRPSSARRTYVVIA